MRKTLLCLLLMTLIPATMARADDPPAPPELAPAERISPPPPNYRDPRVIVNQLPYEWMNLDPAVDAFHLVTAFRGWPLEDIAAWTPFVREVMARESGGCWNVLRGAIVSIWEGCVLSRQGRYTDSGFGQVLMSVHKSWLCPQEGLCSPAAVVASPWTSMTAFVALIERAGRQGWCYTAKLRRGRVCQLAP